MLSSHKPNFVEDGMHKPGALANKPEEFVFVTASVPYGYRWYQVAMCQDDIDRDVHDLFAHSLQSTVFVGLHDGTFKTFTTLAAWSEFLSGFRRVGQ